MQYFIKTFGCQMNHSDSERIAGFLENYNFKKADDINQADLVIFNTCGVRQMAEDRVYGQIHNIRKKEVRSRAYRQAGKKKDKLMLVLTGCLANRKDVQRRLKNKVDLFSEIKDLFKNLSELLITNYRLPIKASKQPENYLCQKPIHISNHTAYVPIMSGCNNFCAYCVVPYARGREISRPTDEILNEITILFKKGYKEIVLLGQNVNSYNYVIGNSKLVIRKDNNKNPNYKLPITNYKTVTFPTLLKLIEKIPGQFWISFVSSHPKDYSDELIETIAKSKKICEYIHLPIQAGDDKILAKMNRKYTQKHYLNLVQKIKSAFKKYKPTALYSITSDIIVGFPGETKKQFLESAKVMAKVKYDMVYFGQFSPRPGTAAWNMKDNVKKTEKARREKFLNEILKKTIYDNNKKYVGKEIEVIIDKPGSQEANLREASRSLASGPSTPYYFGRTRTMKNIKLTSKKPVKIGSIVKAKITKANVWNLEGEISK